MYNKIKTIDWLYFYIYNLYTVKRIIISNLISVFSKYLSVNKFRLQLLTSLIIILFFDMIILFLYIVISSTLDRR